MATQRTAPNPIKYPAELPIVEWRQDILKTIADHQVVIVAGETGSGKSTQLPKFCLELGRGSDGLIGHTQPRRIAARSIAERIAEELKVTLGGTVGYKMRFTDKVSDITMVKVMTDGVLLNELQRDRTLRRYDTIIIDEAHERSLNIDFLLGYLKQLLPKRPDLKVIITSATIDTQRFSEHFDDAPIVEVSGRTYPVDVRYRPLIDPDRGEPKDQTEGIIAAVDELSLVGPGDILVFCSGEREIRDAVAALDERQLRHTEILPLYGRLSAADQHRVFSSHTGRRIVVATNVAETSLTVPGIRYVIDTGTARISRFSRKTKVQRLPIEPISQASADQRAGRCGRLGPGICIRLYAEDDYIGRPEFTDPEILRTNLASVILQMSAIGLGDVEDFPFVEPPDTRTVKDGIALLEELQAVEGDLVGQRAWLTDMGRSLARIPLDPRLARMLVAADAEGCLREVLVIVAGLSIIDPRERPTDSEAKALEQHARFKDESSDFIGWLRMWEYITKQRKALSSGQFSRMCRREFLNWRRIREWQDIHSQLRGITKDLGLKTNKAKAAPESIHRAMLTGLLSQIGSKDPDSYEYRGARGARFAINPGSTLFKRGPKWVMAAELVETTRMWARVVAGVDPDVVEELGEHLVARHLSDPWWDAEQGAVLAYESSSILGMQLVADRVVQFSRFDEPGARTMFIEHALVLGEWESTHEFVAKNQAKIQSVLELEARGRRNDLLVGDDAIVRFFAARIPEDIVSVHGFDSWWNRTKRETPQLLDLAEDDLIAEDAGFVDEEQFPATWQYGDLDLALRYEFDPNSPTDGVTVSVPLSVLDRIDPTGFEWNVAGFREDLIVALVKSLPKRLRRQFVPVPDTAREIASEVHPDDGPLVEILRGALTRRSGEVIMPDDFNLEAVPPHLRPRFEVVDEHGAVVATGDRLADVRDELRQEVQATVAEVSHPMERDGITEWDFDDFSRSVAIGEGGRSITVYPALVDAFDSVSIRLFADPQEQYEAMWNGVRRLALLQLPSPGRLLRTVLSSDATLLLYASPYESQAEWMDDCLIAALDAAMIEGGGLVWTAEDFEALVLVVRSTLAHHIESVGALSVGILEELHTLTAEFEDLPEDRFDDVLDDVQAQIRQLIYPRFLSGIGAERLSHIARYLQATTYRLEKVGSNPHRDRTSMATIHALEDELNLLVDAIPFRPLMTEIVWMLQELRVSLFAQHIGTDGPISPKRVRRALEDLAVPE